METVDDYVDLTTPAVGANGVDGVSIPMPLGHHHGHVSDPSMSSRDGDSSDPDHDEESGEELPQQPLHETKHSISSDPSSAMGMPTPISQLSNLMAHHPHFLSKLKNEPNDVEMTDYHKQQQSGIEALQAVMSSANFNMPFPFPPPAAFLNPNHHSSHAHTIGSGGGVGGGGGVVGLSGNSNNPIPSSASSHSSESSQGSARNISDAREGSNNAQNNNGSQQSSNWSFEEQFKQKNCELLNMSTKYGNTLEQPKSWCDLKNQPKEESSNPPEEVSIQLKEQLYEINDDPKRKEFLDELFSFMQSRGTPINRLPIMAKSVLDLHELYNLVVIRGGLVKVIEKKLWQEIIKGLSLPSSITSAAFTLRTQYMKYLYTYECEKHNFSSPSELQAAIDGNRREGRRSSYTAFSGGGSGGGGGSGADNSMSRNSHGQNSLSLHAQMSPLALVGGQHLNQQSMMNGGGAHTPMSHHPHGLPGQPHFPGMTGLTPEMESHMLEYFKIMNADAIQRINAAAVNSSPTINRHGSTSPTSKTSPREGSFAASDMRASFPLWNLYNNNNIYPSLQQTPVSPQAPNSPTAQAASPEPQREALDLGLRSSPISSTVNRPPSLPHSNLQVKKERDLLRKPNKRPYSDDENITETPTTSLPGTHIKIVNNKNGENSLAVSMELNGVMYEGVLLAQTDRRNNNNSTIAKGNLNGY